MSNYPYPDLTQASYNYGNGILTLTGTDLVPVGGDTNDFITKGKATFTGEGDASYTIPPGSLTSNVELDATNPDTKIIITLDAADKVIVNGLLNNNGHLSSATVDASTQDALSLAAGALAGAPSSTPE